MNTTSINALINSQSQAGSYFFALNICLTMAIATIGIIFDLEKKRKCSGVRIQESEGLKNQEKDLMN
ncbi:hypothetical protein IQ244_07025 [Nostoc sp. LEGE 06077]|uniref:hypothetical protein n=1 Tax=Nostoc sp. LEGE 06077 TaxID=915325 RepID=UPI0018825A5C|nr:hypothetical protein [Nostoc sp. LEGE 06077]MBE9206266.1 hypothetical protein [Nostoc sp. LEGE 06077]